MLAHCVIFFFFQAEDGIRDLIVTGVQTCALPIFEKDAGPVSIPGPQAVRIPRSYALVVGIANYQNLAAPQQLQFPERDAEAIYSILISTEGGNFRAENVHKLIGAKATLAGLRHELEEWLPSVTKDDDRVLI